MLHSTGFQVLWRRNTSSWSKLNALKIFREFFQSVALQLGGILTCDLEVWLRSSRVAVTWLLQLSLLVSRQPWQHSLVPTCRLCLQQDVLMCFLFRPLIALVNGYMFSLVTLSLAPMERGLCIIAIWVGTRYGPAKWGTNRLPPLATLCLLWIFWYWFHITGGSIQSVPMHQLDCKPCECLQV